MKIKKINFRQPKYILPLIVLLPLLFIIYNVVTIFSGPADESPAADSLNVSLPATESVPLEGKLKEMEKVMPGTDDYSAIMGFNFKDDDNDFEINKLYQNSELDSIDKYQAQKEAEERAEEAARKRAEEAARHYNKYRGNISFADDDDKVSQSNAISSYQNTLRQLQEINKMYSDEEEEHNDNYLSNSLATPTKAEEAEEPKVVEKIINKDDQYFNTVKQEEELDAPLIKAIIDQSIKAKVGTRLRFKLLDDVRVQGITLPKNTYLYGMVTGFQDQRVLASIQNVMYRDKFIPINLSVYDIDGMQGFYVPKSVFREFVKDAASQSLSSNNLNISTSSQSAEGMALQALQNVYQSATQAISSNIRRQKAKIKYNTIIYLVNQN